ncbi:MAG: glycosyltransferase family 4 protein [Rhodoferax sp.]|nr:glycosyltransferase family 4 protein [Rhodoferax sp.]
MKILVLSFYFRPDLSAGAFRTTALVRALTALAPEAEIKVVTTLPNRYQSFAIDAPEYEVVDGVSITRIALPSHQSGMLDQSKAFLHFARVVLKVVRNDRYDLVYATSSRLMTAVLGSWISMRKSCPLYLDIRDIFVDTVKDVLPRRIAGPIRVFFSLLERRAVARAISVNLVSGGFRDYFASRYPQQRFTFLTNGIDEEFLVVAPTVASPIKTTSPLNVLYAGNLGEGQGMHTILPELARRSIGRVHFTVYGDGGRKSLLLDRLSELKITNVEVRPPVSRAQLIDAYQTADVLFLHLGDYDAFTKVLPSKIFEYAAMGKPIWAGIPGFSAEFVRNEIENVGVFPPGDVDAAIQALDRLVIHDIPRAEFVEKYSRDAICLALATDILAMCHA